MFSGVAQLCSSLVTNNLVSLQPMNLPACLVFYMDFRYSNVYVRRMDDILANLKESLSDIKNIETTKKYLREIERHPIVRSLNIQKEYFI